MFSTKNTVDVTKSAISQLIGKGYMDEADGNITALDDQYIVDLGKKIIADSDGNIDVNSPADIFFKALLSQMGKIVIDTRSYVAQLPSLYVDVVNWGLFSEQVMIGLSDVMIDEIWNPDGYINFSDPAKDGKLSGEAEGARIAAIEFGCYKPPVNVRLYQKAHGIMVALTTARDQFFTAFRSLDEYNRFLAGLYNSVENTLQVKAEVYALMTVSMGIAKAKANGNEINLLHEYNTLTQKTLTQNNWITDEDCQKYVLRRIEEITDNMMRYNADYNNHDVVTFASSPKKILLKQFATAAKFGVRANTFNESLLGIGEYDTVNAWQASKSATETTPYNLTAASQIVLTKAAADEAGLDTSASEIATEGYKIDGVIGVIYDERAMGICLDRKSTTSSYSGARDSINHFYHALVNYIVNDNYPIVSIVMRDA